MYIFFLSIFYEIVSKPIDRQEKGEKDLLIVIRYDHFDIYISVFISCIGEYVKKKNENMCIHYKN